jgi:hypothetical protein
MKGEKVCICEFAEVQKSQKTGSANRKSAKVSHFCGRSAKPANYLSPQICQWEHTIPALCFCLSNLSLIYAIPYWSAQIDDIPLLLQQPHTAVAYTSTYVSCWVEYRFSVLIYNSVCLVDTIAEQG